MTKNNKHAQGSSDDEKYIREHTHVVRAPRLQPKVKEGMMQLDKKPKKNPGDKGSIPRM